MMPKRLIVAWRVHERLGAQKFGVYAEDQHLLVIGPVEDADPPPFRQIARGPPQKIVLQFNTAGMFEAEYLATLGVHAGHHVSDRTVFSSCIHRLENQQDRVAV